MMELSDERIKEIEGLKDGLPRRSGAILRRVIDDLLADREAKARRIAELEQRIRQFNDEGYSDDIIYPLALRSEVKP